MTHGSEPLAWVIFGVIVAGMLAVDLGVFHRRAHEVRVREAAVWSLIWVSLALAFNLGIYLHSGRDRALEFLQAWLIEKALSVDNLLVFLSAFTFFAVPAHLQHRVLFLGILGALVTRGAFIAIGAALLAAFHWVTYVFGGFLVITAIQFLVGGDKEEHPEHNPVLRLFRRFVRMTPDYVGSRFLVRRNGLLYATPLLMVLVVVEATDVVFAVDSIPAVFGVTRDVFIVYTSNIFAVFGLRALCFLVASLVRRLRFLKPALAFVGGKMLVADRYRISDGLSLMVVGGLIVGAALLSMMFPASPSDRALDR